MSVVDEQVTVGQLVRERPARGRVFEQLGIDYCCGGKKPLAQACAERSLDAATVVRMLEASESAAPAAPSEDPSRMTLTQLADHIEATHHAYLRTELPRLGAIVAKVAAVHGPQRPELTEVHRTFGDLTAEMNSHMNKEEHILFPMIRQMEAADSPPQFHCGTIAAPIGVMEHEHDSAGAAVAKMRQLTDNYTPPADACNTYRVMLESLARLESDLHEHVHKENNILFPCAVELELSLKARVA